MRGIPIALFVIAGVLSPSLMAQQVVCEGGVCVVSEPSGYSVEYVVDDVPASVPGGRFVMMPMFDLPLEPIPAASVAVVPMKAAVIRSGPVRQTLGLIGRFFQKRKAIRQGRRAVRQAARCR